MGDHVVVAEISSIVCHSKDGGGVEKASISCKHLHIGAVPVHNSDAELNKHISLRKETCNYETRLRSHTTLRRWCDPRANPNANASSIPGSESKIMCSGIWHLDQRVED